MGVDIISDPVIFLNNQVFEPTLTIETYMFSPGKDWVWYVHVRGGIMMDKIGNSVRRSWNFQHVAVSRVSILSDDPVKWLHIL